MYVNHYQNPEKSALEIKPGFGCSYENVYWYHNQVYTTTH